MKLRRVSQGDEPEYPSFEEYQENRRKFLKGLAAGVGAVALVGCDKKHEPHIAGEMPAPEPSSDPQKVCGKPVTTQPPEREPVELEGDIAMPEPIPRPPEKVPPVKGRISAPEPPRRMAGKIKAPNPPPKPKPEEAPEIGGVPPAPQQPRLRGAVAAPLQEPGAN